MPQWLMATGHSEGWEVGSGIEWTRYQPPYAYLWDVVSEIKSQAIARDTYTLSKLFVRIIANGQTASATIRTRKNGGNGNQSVSIPATGTGIFQDTVNTDSLVNGNLFNYQIVTGAGGTAMVITLLSVLLGTVSNTTPIIGFSAYAASGGGGLTRYYPLMGGATSYFGFTAEARAQYTFRVAATLSNLRIWAYSFHLATSTVRTRVNGGNGNQSVSIPEDTDGNFEDAVNTDNISIGDTVDIQEIRGGTTGAGSSFYCRNGQVKSNSSGRQTACAYGMEPLHLKEQDYNVTLYIPLEGSQDEQTGTELNVQCLTRMAFDAGNFFVNAPVNTTNGARTVNTRINGGDGSLSVSIGAAATGTFEDLVNSDTLIATDLYNFKSGTGGTSGYIVLTIVGVQIPYEAPAPPYTPENKSANMGAKLVAGQLI